MLRNLSELVGMLRDGWPSSKLICSHETIAATAGLFNPRTRNVIVVVLAFHSNLNRFNDTFSDPMWRESKAGKLEKCNLVDLPRPVLLGLIGQQTSVSTLNPLGSQLTPHTSYTYTPMATHLKIKLQPDA